MHSVPRNAQSLTWQHLKEREMSTLDGSDRFKFQPHFDFH